MRLKNLIQLSRITDVGLHKLKVGDRFQLFQSTVLKLNIVIVIEIINAHNGGRAIGQAFN